MARTWREWERPLLELEEGIVKLRAAQAKETPARAAAIEDQIRNLERSRDNYIRVKYSRLGPWERVLISRAENRPYMKDYVDAFVGDWVELHGDRRFGDDKAIVGGVGTIGSKSCVIVGHQKGRDLKARQHRNFAMAKPEGYRKAIRLFDMADRFGLPVVSFIDTPAADPGAESESRGISEAIAAGMFKMFSLGVPTVGVIIGEGGSGGAIGIGACSRTLMLENAVYSVIPPEGCAAILWRDPGANDRAASALKLTAQHALEFGLIDEVVSEGLGGAHRRPGEAIHNVEDALVRNLASFEGMSRDQIRSERYEKYRLMGVTAENIAATRGS
ncbi:MAG TPA: acetyl-CoA carboxylase carboxyltransferase subunit alpha [Fimbriimonadales bacterium]|nr:acetyl-CoA carboxylase carboxyltransferase subunit alpha [Fimbriimonadales bacterium]